MSISRELVFGKLPVVHSLGGANPYPVILVFDNRLISRVGTSVIADSEAAEGNLDAVNLGTEYSWDKWRSDSVLTRSQAPTPEVAVKFALSRSSSVNWLSYHWSNILVPWRADLYRGDPDAGGTLLDTTDWTHPIVKSTPEDFYFDNFPWILGPSNERVATMANERQLSSFCQLATPAYGVDHVLWRFDVTDGINGVVDYLQAALMIAGRTFQPAINMSTGCNVAPVDRSISKRTAAGVDTGVDRPTHSELSFTLESLTAHEAMTRLFTDWVRTQPKSARIFVYQEPAPEDRLRYYDGAAFVGTREDFSGVSVEEEPGSAGDVFVAKSVKGITIEQTA